MTKIGRNEPCPCGSGLKYKHCCARRDADQELLAARIPGEVGRSWQADILPFPASFEDDPRARPTTAMVVSNGYVLASRMSSTPLGEVSEIADKLATAIEEARQTTGVSPEEVVVRWPDVRRALSNRLAGGPQVRVAPVLDDLIVPMRELLKNVAEFPYWPPVSNPDSWLAWGLPRPVIAELFDAAADFHRTAPWRLLSEVPPLEASIDGGREWTIAIMGSGGDEFGLSMYELFDDYIWTITTEELEANVAGLRGCTIALTYSPLGELPRPVQREVASNGWRVASPNAYPVLMPVNTPAGGISSSDASDLISLLRAIPAFVEQHRDVLDSSEWFDTIEWEHEQTGTTITYDPGPLDPWYGYDVEQDHAFVEPQPPRRTYRRRGTARHEQSRPARPQRGSPEAGVALLGEALEWINRFAERQPESMRPVVDHAKQLLSHYAGLFPEEMSRAMKPEVWAAGALHAAFHLDAPGIGASAFADAFGVSTAAVNVRSRRLRERASGSGPPPPQKSEQTLDLWSTGEEDDMGDAGARSEREASTQNSAPAMTPLQGQYLAFIHYYTKLHKQPPAESDLQQYFRVTPPAVHDMIMKLVQKKLISKVPGQPRTMRVLVPRELLPDLE